MTEFAPNHPRWLEVAKAKIDNGLSRLGKSLDSSHPLDRSLMILSARSVAVADAIALLCLRDHAAEASPLAIGLVELAAEMREIAESGGEDRARAFLEQTSPLFGGSGSAESLSARLERLGFQEKLRRAAAHGRRYFVWGGAGGLPWSHLFDVKLPTDFSRDDWVEVAAIAMGHVLKALEARWPKAFAGAAESLWSDVERGRKPGAEAPGEEKSRRSAS